MRITGKHFALVTDTNKQQRKKLIYSAGYGR
jgi:hypothetical protein